MRKAWFGMILAHHDSRRGEQCPEERKWRLERRSALISDPQSHRLGLEPKPSDWTAYLILFLAAWALTHVAIALVQFPEVLAGEQVDSDGYFRLMRVGLLLEGGGWYNSTIPTSNWPFGQELHWTRPLDIIIIILALPWCLAFPVETAVAIVGGLISPLLHLVLCLVGVWVIAPLVSGPTRFIAAAALLAQPGVMAYATAGRADHHILVLLFSILAIGSWIRALMDPNRARWGLWSGIAAAAALWVSPEALVPLAAIFASGGVAWVVHGSDYARANLRLALGLTLGLCVAIIVERPPGEWLVAEYDRISAVHILMGLLAGGFWITGNSIYGFMKGSRDRLIFSCGGALVAFGFILAFHPGFFWGPGASMEPWLKDFAFAHIEEMQPIVGASWQDLGSTIAILGLTPVALWFVGYTVLHGKREAHVGWYPLLAGVLLFVPMAAAQARMVGYAGAVLALVATGLLGALLKVAVERYEVGIRRRAARLGTMVAILLGPLILGGMVSAMGGTAGPSSSAISEGSCNLPDAIRILDEARQGRSEPFVVAVSPNLGPALAYTTGDRIVAGPYHRSPEGLRDLLQLFQSSDMGEAELLARSRSVDIVLICAYSDGDHFGGGYPASLSARLADGTRIPQWLHPTNTGETGSGGFLAYRVISLEDGGR